MKARISETVYFQVGEQRLEAEFVGNRDLPFVPSSKCELQLSPLPGVDVAPCGFDTELSLEVSDSRWEEKSGEAYVYAECSMKRDTLEAAARYLDDLIAWYQCFGFQLDEGMTSPDLLKSPA